MRTRLLFSFAGLYNVALGVAFARWGPEIYRWAELTPPNHWGYVQFPAFLAVVFGALFFAVAFRPQANRNLIPFGLLFLASYISVVFIDWTASGVPWLFKAVAAVHVVLFTLLGLAYRALGKPAKAP